MAEEGLPKADLFLSKSGQGALLWVELVLASGFVAFRTFIQYRHNKKLFSNDWLILGALALHFFSALVGQLMIPWMYGVEDLKVILAYGMTPPADFTTTFTTYLKYQFASCILFWCTLWAVKFSLLLFFWRLFDSLHTRIRIFWYVMCFITAATLLTTVFLQLFACGSPGSFFKLGEEGCSTERDIYMSNLVFLFSAGTDIACDVFLIFIPFPLLWKLQVSQKQRIVLVLIFLLPLIPICFGILRLVFCNPVTGTVNVIKFTFYFMLENTAAIITACLPSMRLFFLQKSANTTARPSQPYGSAHIYADKKSVFSHTRSQKSEFTKGAIPLRDMSAERVGSGSGEGESRNSGESRSRILGKGGVLVTTEYQVSSAAVGVGDEERGKAW